MHRPLAHPDTPRAPKRKHTFRAKEFFKLLGPGLITGASDDDPSGIATYSQAGAKFGYGQLWTLVFTLPLMASMQEISARIGRTSGRGIAGNVRRHYPRWLLFGTVALLVTANVINIGADIGAMGEALSIVIGGPAIAYAVLFAAGSLLLEIFISYEKYARYLKWMSLVLLSYVATALILRVSWKEALQGALMPRLGGTSDAWTMVIAIFGTTISPYLFFWQASQETEEIQTHAEEAPVKEQPREARTQYTRIRFDTYTGMIYSNVVAFFIMLAAGATLHARGVHDIETAAQAAEALRPLAGEFTFLLFALGIVGTGLLAIPVLAGSAAYALGEAFNWPCGLARKPLNARAFYGALSGATILGLAINFPFVQKAIHGTPMQALVWAAVINGIASVPIMVVIMRMARSAKVMGKFVVTSRWLRVTGWLATTVMACAAVGMIVAMVWK